MKNIFALVAIMLLVEAPKGFSQKPNGQKGQFHIFQSDRNGFNAKTIFYDDGKEIVAFGALFNNRYAQQAIDSIRKLSKSPIKWLVALDPSPEQINGIDSFRKAGAKVIMSKLTVKNIPDNHAFSKDYYINISKIFTDSSYPKLPKADITFDDNYTLKLANGSKIILTELKQSAGANNQTIAYFPNDSALVVGDLINHNSHLWLEGPIVKGKYIYNNDNWIKALRTLESKNYPPSSLVYGAHGYEAILAEAVPQQISYLQKAERTVRLYLLSLKGNTAKEKLAYVDYALLTKLFLHTFPAYDFDYKIKYGLHGMVEEVLASMYQEGK